MWRGRVPTGARPLASAAEGSGIRPKSLIIGGAIAVLGLVLLWGLSNHESPKPTTAGHSETVRSPESSPTGDSEQRGSLGSPTSPLRDEEVQAENARKAEFARNLHSELVRECPGLRRMWRKLNVFSSIKGDNYWTTVVGFRRKPKLLISRKGYPLSRGSCE